jgi:hypothetical protein
MCKRTSNFFSRKLKGQSNIPLSDHSTVTGLLTVPVFRKVEYHTHMTCPLTVSVFRTVEYL